MPTQGDIVRRENLSFCRDCDALPQSPAQLAQNCATSAGFCARIAQHGTQSCLGSSANCQTAYIGAERAGKEHDLCDDRRSDRLTIATVKLLPCETHHASAVCPNFLRHFVQPNVKLHS